MSFYFLLLWTWHQTPGSCVIRISKLTTMTDFNRDGFVNEFSVSTVDLSKTCVERCKTYEPFKMKAVSSCETSGAAEPVTQDHVPEGRNPSGAALSDSQSEDGLPPVFSRPTQLPFLLLTFTSCLVLMKT